MEDAVDEILTEILVSRSNLDADEPVDDNREDEAMELDGSREEDAEGESTESEDGEVEEGERDQAEEEEEEDSGGTLLHHLISSLPAASFPDTPEAGEASLLISIARD